MNFENQVAVSTGAASGMGLLFAENWATLGGTVETFGRTDFCLISPAEEVQ